MRVEKPVQEDEQARGLRADAAAVQSDLAAPLPDAEVGNDIDIGIGSGGNNQMNRSIDSAISDASLNSWLPSNVTKFMEQNLEGEFMGSPRANWSSKDNVIDRLQDTTSPEDSWRTNRLIICVYKLYDDEIHVFL